MEIQLIRNATMRIRYGSTLFVTDPLLAPRLSMKSYAGKSLNPLVDLPLSPEEVLAGAKMVLLSHIHSDHFDATAQRLLPKDMPIFCQPADLGRLGELGFSDLRPVETESSFEGIRIIRTEGSHGRGAVLEEMGMVSGFVLSSPGEPTVYWVGDSILYEEIYRSIDRYAPELIITHSSGAVWGDRRDLIVMDSAQTIAVARYASGAAVVAVHVDALDHGTTTRLDLARARDEAGISPERLCIPQDGERIVVGKLQ